jgi:hypothetical protein
MEDDVLQKIQKRLAELPEDVRQAIQSTDFAKTIQTIGAKHQLHIDQMASIEDEVYMVMLGFEDTAQLPGNIANALSIDATKAAEIVEDINTGIFLPIRASMQAFIEKQKGGGAVPAPAPAAPVTPADMMLSQKMVSMPAQKPQTLVPPAVTAPKVGNSYKVDPYREPAE